MDLLSVFKRHSAAPAAVDSGEPIDTVADARKRARQRLIGATILVIIAVIGFPIVFDTAPRPVAVDVPIEIPRKEGGAPLVMPQARLPSQATTASGAAAPVAAAGPAAAGASAPRVAGSSSAGVQASPALPVLPAAPAPSGGAAVASSGKEAGVAGVPGVITETPKDAGREVRPPVPDAVAAVGPPGPPPGSAVRKAPAANAAAEHAAAKPTPRTSPSTSTGTSPASTTSPPATDSGRARALLEDKPVARLEPSAAAPKPAAADSRFAIQVAAFSGDQAAAEMRGKLEKAGVKSYTQVVETPAGRRIRVRVGPFNSRDEAERAAGKIKAAGLPSSIVPL